MAVKSANVLKPVANTYGGVNVLHHKNTSSLKIVRMPTPGKVVLPMQQHIGEPCTPVVKVGDNVSVGQLIADSDRFVSVPIHASVSGTVTSIEEVKTASGSKVPAVTIESDGQMRLYEFLRAPKITGREDFLMAVRASGLVGLGGVGFPAHVKLGFKPDNSIDTLIINAAECEPYITVDHRECIDNSLDVLSGANIIKEILGFKNVIIAIEDNKLDAFNELQKIIEENDKYSSSIKLMVLKSHYPQGAEKVLIRSVTGRRVPPGKNTEEVGCVIMNVSGVAFLSRYMKTGKPLVSRSLTVDGSAIAEPKNVRVPIGTNIGDIIDFCGGFKSEPFKVLCGGPMTGIALEDTNIPLLKSNNAILAFANESVTVKPETDCIRCGRCAKVCPMHLMPTRIEKFANSKETDKLENTGITVCIECGCCAFACPAGRPLVQYMRNAKAALTKAGDKNE